MRLRLPNITDTQNSSTMATTVERAVLDSLVGHTSQAGLDLVKYAFRNSKGLAGALRRNGMLPLISEDGSSL